MAGRVEKHDVPAVDRDVVRADVLGDAAGLALGDSSFADGVEQTGLAVVDVTHDRDDRRARHDVFGLDLLGVDLRQLFLEAAHLDLGAELAGEHRRRLGIERRVDGHHQPLHQQLAEDVLDADVELVGQVLDRHSFGEGDRPRHRRRRGRLDRHAGPRPAVTALAATGTAADTTAASAVSLACRDAADTEAAAANRAATAAVRAATAAVAGLPASVARSVTVRHTVDAAASGRAPGASGGLAAGAPAGAAVAPAGRAATAANRPIGARRRSMNDARRRLRRQRRRRRGRPLFFDAETERRRDDTTRCYGFERWRCWFGDGGCGGRRRDGGWRRRVGSGSRTSFAAGGSTGTSVSGAASTTGAGGGGRRFGDDRRLFDDGRRGTGRDRDRLRRRLDELRLCLRSR